MKNILLSILIIQTSAVGFSQNAAPKIDPETERALDINSTTPLSKQLELELRCKYLVCGYKSMMIGIDEDEHSSCGQLAKLLIKKSFNGSFDEIIIFWQANNKDAAVRKMCPAAAESLDIMNDITEKSIAEGRKKKAERDAGQSNDGSVDPRLSEPAREPSPEMGQGVDAMNAYVAQALDPKSNTPLYPEYQQMLECEFLACSYVSAKVGLEPGDKMQCDRFSEVLMVKAFKNSLMDFSNWWNQFKRADQLEIKCPQAKPMLEKLEKHLSTNSA